MKMTKLSLITITVIGFTTSAVATDNNWNYSGQIVTYTQTVDQQGKGDLFSGKSTYGAVGAQLGAVNKDLINGLGVGIEISTVEQDKGYSDLTAAGGNALTDSAGITQAYITKAIANTSFKVGRQTLPKSLSPFAYSEGWQIFKNTYDAVLAVNSDISNTTLVGAWVNKANRSVGDISTFKHIDQGPIAEKGIYMIAAQNKSIQNLTLTGNYYLAPDMTSNFSGGGDVHAVWADAKLKVANLNIALQGGAIMPDGTIFTNSEAIGAKIGTNIGDVKAHLAFSSTNDGSVPIHNWGTSVKTPLYTQSVLNQNTIKKDSDTIKLAASTKALSGTITGYYQYSDLGAQALSSVFNNGNNILGGSVAGEGEYSETAAMYKTKLATNTTVFAAYVHQDDDRLSDTQNFVRVWARYNF